MSYDNNGRGALWGNKDKKKDTHPDFKGNFEMNGVEYWVSAWRRGEGDNPKAPALRFQVTPKQEVHNQGRDKVQQAVNEAQQINGFAEDSIPF